MPNSRPGSAGDPDNANSCTGRDEPRQCRCSANTRVYIYRTSKVISSVLSEGRSQARDRLSFYLAWNNYAYIDQVKGSGRGLCPLHPWDLSPRAPGGIAGRSIKTELSFRPARDLPPSSPVCPAHGYRPRRPLKLKLRRPGRRFSAAVAATPHAPRSVETSADPPPAQQ